MLKIGENVWQLTLYFYTHAKSILQMNSLSLYTSQVMSWKLLNMLEL